MPVSSIEVKDLTKSFGETRVVGPVSLRIESGEFVSLLGPSGCGKTTTLRMIAGFEQPSTGTIHIGDRIANDIPVERRGVGLVFQSYALFPHLSVAGNVEFGLRLRGESAAGRGRKVAEMLKLVGLEGLEARLPRQLSGGQQQRVALARALAVRPSVLLFDEPLSNLDLKLREQMRDEIRRLRRALGITAIYVTHDQGEAMAMSDRIAVMNRGVIEQIGTPADVYERPATLFVARFIGQCNVLQGRFDQDGGEIPVFVTDGGTRLRMGTDSSRFAMKPGELSNVVIRPEAVNIDFQAAAGINRFQARIEDVVYLGERTSLTLSLGGASDRLQAAVRYERGMPRPCPGEHVTVRIDPRDCVVVDSVGEARTA
jgi:ABC-type Fe3+/spermidine/putrescine transport system ATPase subunit